LKSFEYFATLAEKHQFTFHAILFRFIMFTNLLRGVLAKANIVSYTQS